MRLDAKVVDQSLALPDDHDLHVRISQLKNPLLTPVELQPLQGLTPDQAAILAVIINPELRAQRDQHLISQAALMQAGILPNPQLTYGYDFNTGGTTFGSVNAYGIGVNWDITSLISHTAKTRSASWTAQSVDLNIAWQEWQVAEAAMAAAIYLMLLRSQQQVAGEVNDRLADNLKLIRRAADLGLKTTVDVSAAESAARDAHAVLLQTNRDAEHQLLALKHALGVPGDTQIHLKQTAGNIQSFTPPSAADLLADLEDHRLDLVALRQGYQAQEQTLVAAHLDQFPRLNLGFSKNQDNTGVRSIGLGVTLDIPLFDRNQGVISAEKANRQKLYDEYRSRVFEARADIAMALADIESINLQIADAQAAIPNLQKLVDVYKEAVDHGNADVLSYYTAWNELSQKKLDLLKLQQQLAENRIALEIASGKYFTTGSATTQNDQTPRPQIPVKSQ
jgi:cobalt-zinc-cadmium efflux system outer membrane protein